MKNLHLLLLQCGKVKVSRHRLHGNRARHNLTWDGNFQAWPPPSGGLTGPARSPRQGGREVTLAGLNHKGDGCMTSGCPWAGRRLREGKKVERRPPKGPLWQEEEEEEKEWQLSQAQSSHSTHTQPRELPHPADKARLWDRRWGGGNGRP